MRKWIIGLMCLGMGLGMAQAATFTVSTAADSGAGSLRQAIVDSSSSEPPNEIVFSIGSPYTIQPLSALPNITNQVHINAVLGDPNPTVTLDGSLAGAGISGLRIQYTSNCIVQGLRICNFAANGIYVYNAESNLIQRCAIYSNQYGIILSGSSRNLIGGSSIAVKNTISANDLNGLTIYGTSVSNQIAGNFIGTDEAGTNAWPNLSSGIQLSGGIHTLVGGVNSVAGGPFPGNVISGNGVYGLYINTTNGQTLVLGNLVGLNRYGLAAVPNAQAGICCNNSPSNQFGGTGALTRNAVSGNGNQGVFILNTQAVGNVVSGNFIGTDKNGTLAVPNGLDGIEVYNAPNNRIGGAGAEGNLVSGNTQSGINIEGPSIGNSATGNVIQSNFIGTDSSGTLPLPNLGPSGLRISCPQTLVGGSNRGNVIAGNLGNGVQVSGEGHGAVMRGNWIGPYDPSLVALSNRVNGIYLSGVSNCVIGGTNLLDRNIISGNGFSGISLYGSACVENTILGNIIGVDSSGSTAVGNLEHGIFIYQAPSNQVGLGVSGGKNLISGNGLDGISIWEGDENTIENNFIGTDGTGRNAIPNEGNGIYLWDCRGCDVGGYDTFEGNLISGNDANGMMLTGSGCTSNQITGNRIGSDLTGTNALRNSDHGLRFASSCYSNLVGGGSGDGNDILFNGKDGVYVEDSAHGIAIVGNSFAHNGGLGIDLSPEGRTPNDVLDADSGANGLPNFPILTTISNNGTHVILSGYLETEPLKDYRVEFFFNRSCDPTGYGEGEYVMALVSNLTTDASGFAVFTNLALELHDPPPDFVTATASDLELWNTSEFSPFILLDSDGDGMGDGYEDEYFGGYQSGNPAGDMDGDGSLNGEEFDADTSPIESDSIFRLAGMSNQPAQTLVGLESSDSREYMLQHREAMEDGLPWTDLSGLWSHGTGDILIFTHGTVFTTQFYRAKARIPIAN